MKTLTNIFNASHIAVVGASREPQKVGYQLLANLKQNPKLTLFPVNLKAKSILGIKCFSHLSSISAPLDVIVICTPAATVLEVVTQIVDRNKKQSHKVKSVVLISAGFSESGQEGLTLQNQVLKVLSEAHIELLGPNTLGIIHPHHDLNMSFSGKKILPGKVAAISQSGALLVALFDQLNSIKAGVSFAVSLGNKAGINENDCLEYAAHDPHTSSIVMYLESISNVEKFFEVVSKVSKLKPVLLLKGGTSLKGSAASLSHTAALATNNTLLQAAAQQIGYVLVDTVEQFLNAASFLAIHKNIPENTMIITNAGGLAVNTVDSLSHNKVALANWSQASHRYLSDHLPNIHPSNPLDLLGDASPDRFQSAVTIGARDVNIDSLLVIVTQQAVTEVPAIVDVLTKLKTTKPIFVALVGGDQLASYRQALHQAGITCFEYPNEIAEVLGILSQLKRLQYLTENFEALPKTLSAIQTTSNAVPDSIKDSFRLMAKYGFHIPRFTIITSPTAVPAISLPYPLFAKTANMQILHKAQQGGVIGLVHSHHETQAAFKKLQKLGAQMLLQEVIDTQIELLLGLETDPQFGAFLSIGLGGGQSNLLADRAYVFLPASKKQMEQSFKKTKAYAVVNSTHPRAINKIVNHMCQLQELWMQTPTLKMLEINPLVVNVTGTWALDLKIV